MAGDFAKGGHKQLYMYTVWVFSVKVTVAIPSKCSCNVMNAQFGGESLIVSIPNDTFILLATEFN